MALSTVITFFSLPAYAYNPMFDGWLMSNAPAISAGGGGSFINGEPVCAAANPAGLAANPRFSISFHESLRTMPSFITEKSPPQLIGGTQYFTMPLAPGLTFTSGGNAGEKLGFDWRDATGVGGLPRERFFADERIEAVGISLSAWTKAGISRRSFVHEFERLQVDEEYYERLLKIAKPGRIKSLKAQPSFPADSEPYFAKVFWRRMGGGEIIGVRQTVFPGVVYTKVRERVKFDYAGGETGRMKYAAAGLEISPAAWLTLYFESENRTGAWRAAAGSLSAIPESKNVRRKFIGIKLNLAGIAEVSAGKRGAMKSWGVKLILKPVSISYSECKNYLSKIAGRPLGNMQNVHAASVEIAAP